MTKNRMTARRPLIFVSVTTSATTVPRKTARTAPPTPTMSEFLAAIQVLEFDRPASIAEVESTPPGTMISIMSRSIGKNENRTISAATTAVRAISWP
jgi:hypothetical protein